METTTQTPQSIEALLVGGTIEKQSNDPNTKMHVDRSLVYDDHRLVLSSKWRVKKIKGKEKYAVHNVIGYNTEYMASSKHENIADMEIDAKAVYHVVKNADGNLALASNSGRSPDRYYINALTWDTAFEAALFITRNIA